jgi:hypothetical protein
MNGVVNWLLRFNLAQALFQNRHDKQLSTGSNQTLVNSLTADRILITGRFSETSSA